MTGAPVAAALPNGQTKWTGPLQAYTDATAHQHNPHFRHVHFEAEDDDHDSTVDGFGDHYDDLRHKRTMDFGDELHSNDDDGGTDSGVLEDGALDGWDEREWAKMHELHPN